MSDYERKNQTLRSLNQYPFTPAWWLNNRHLQTIYVGLVRKYVGHIGAPKLRHERWDTDDGDFLDLLILDGHERKPIVVLFHGMEGTPWSYYIPGFAKQLKRLGWTLIVMFFRSCGFGMNRTAKLYHLGSTEDPEFVIHKICEMHPNQQRFAIGVSLGGNVLAKLLGEQGPKAKGLLDAAAVISAPFDPVATAPTFHQLLWGFYAWHFVRTLKKKALDIARRYPGLLDETAIRRAYDFYTFDDAVTATLYGFANAIDYWEKSSCTPKLKDICIPTLLIASRDDQFVLPEVLPIDICDASPYLYPLFTDKGGHAAFVYGTLPCCARYWYEEQTIRFFRAHEKP